MPQYIPDPAQSYELGYHMKIYAGYLSTTFSLFKFLNVEAGARFEHTDVQIDDPNTSIPSYNNLVHFLIFSHNFKDEQSLKLAFTRRIERAEYRDINPFMNLSNLSGIRPTSMFRLPIARTLEQYSSLTARLE